MQASIQTDNGFYSYDRIDDTNANYRMIIGERSNGKTYGALKKIVYDYADNQRTGAYIRRYREDFTGKRGQTLFASLVADGIIEEATNGEWNSVKYYSGCWYFQDDTSYGKPRVDTQPFCYGFSISSMEHDKSTSYPTVGTIIFDEFLTRGTYLNNEFVLFMNVVSTIIRQRDDVVIYMLGNTVSQYCPYFKEMGITGIKEMSPGDLDVYSYGESNLRVALEYAPETSEEVKKSNSYFAFDNPQLQMITNGSWEFDLYPHIIYKNKPKDVKLNFFILFDDELLHGELIKNENGLYINLHRKTTEIKYNKDIVYTTEVTANPYRFRRITVATTDKTKLIYSVIKSERVFFQDNSVGETFIHYLNWCKSSDMFRA